MRRLAVSTAPENRDGLLHAGPTSLWALAAGAGVTALVMLVAAITGRFHISRAPVVLRWVIATLLAINLLSVIDAVSVTEATRFLLITVYLAIFAVWLTAYVDRPSRARLVVVTWLAIGVLWRQRRARRWVFALEVTYVVGALILLLLPIGANHGPVALMTNVVLPIAVILLLRKQREAFS